MSGLEGRTILVIGGTAGIGEAIVRKCASGGATTICVGRNEERGRRVAETSGASFIQADISVGDDVARLFDKIERRELRIDGAVNCAGVSQAAVPIDRMDPDEFDRLVATNLRGTWLCVAREVRQMRGRGGSIVNIASIAGDRGFAGLSAYCATKHAIVGLTRAAALDGATDGIRVNAILAGTTRTAMMEEQMVSRPGGLDGTVARIPLGRVAEPEEQANAAAWLLSDDSGFVTGACLSVDGGTTART